MESLELDLAIINFIEKSEMTSTWAIGKRFSIQTAKMLKRMKHLERVGLVERHYFSSVNNIVWKLTDKAKQQGGPK